MIFEAFANALALDVGVFANEVERPLRLGEREDIDANRFGAGNRGQHARLDPRSDRWLRDAEDH